MQVSLYLPAGVIIWASSLHNLRRDVVWIILEEAYVPPASVFELLLRSGGQMGPGFVGLREVRPKPPAIMKYTAIIGEYI